jgi:hypothetical protein
VRDSVVAGSFGDGLVALDFSNGTTNVMVENVALTGNSTGVLSTGKGAKILISNSTVSGNGTGLATDAGCSASNSRAVVPPQCGVLASYGTNRVNDNGADGAPTTTLALK